MWGLTGNTGKSTIPPTPPLEALSIAQLPPYWCITEPCYDNPVLRQVATTYNAPGWLKSWVSGGSSQNWRSKIQTQAPVYRAPIFQPVLSPSPVPDRAAIQPEGVEATTVNPNRPVAYVTSAERDEFIAARASILARYPRYVAGAESDPVFVITDEPPSGSIPTPVTGTSPPTLLGAELASETVAGRGSSPPAGPWESNGGSGQFGEQPMGWLADFGSSLLGSIDFDPATPGIFGSSTESPLTSIPDLIGGLAGSYITGRVATGPADTLPPYVNPTTRVSTTNVVPITTAGRVPVGCISQRDIQIAAAAGTSPEMVDLILKLGRRNRRRRRMLTKSDIGDISTMRQILGNGEAFKLWLAKATR